MLNVTVQLTMKFGAKICTKNGHPKALRTLSPCFGVLSMQQLVLMANWPGADEERTPIERHLLGVFVTLQEILLFGNIVGKLHHAWCSLKSKNGACSSNLFFALMDSL